MRSDAEYAIALQLYERELATKVVAAVGERIVVASFQTAEGAKAEGYYREGWHWTRGRHEARARPDELSTSRRHLFSAGCQCGARRKRCRER